MAKEASKLILPNHLEIEEEKQGMVKEFNRSLYAFIDKNKHLTEPYFIAFHDRWDDFVPVLNRQSFKVYKEMPKFIKNQMVFWVDNKKELVEWLWSVNEKGYIETNHERIQLLSKKGGIRRRRLFGR